MGYTVTGAGPDFYDVQTDDGSTQRVAKVGLTPDQIAGFESARAPLPVFEAGPTPTNPAAPMGPMAPAGVSPTPAPDPMANFRQGPGGPVFDFNKFASNNAPAPAPLAPAGPSADAERAARDSNEVDPSATTLGRAPAPAPAQSGVAMPSSGYLQKADQGISGGFARQTRGIEDAYRVGKEKAAEQLGALEQLQKDTDRINNEAKVREGERQTYLAEETKKFQALSDEVRNGKVEPDKWWSSRSNGEKVTAAIAIALGSIGSALLGQGGKNPAMDIINASIEQDIDAQKANLAQKQAGLSAQSNLIGMARAQFGDERQADAAAKAAMLESVTNKIRMIDTRYMPAEQKARQDQLLGQVEQEKAKYYAQMAQVADDTYTKRLALAAKQQEAADKARGLSVPGLEGTGIGEKEAEKTREAAIAMKQMRASIQRLRSLREKVGSEVWDRKSVVEAQAEAAALQLTYKNLKGLGVLSESDKKDYLDKIIPSDPTRFEWTGSTQAMLDSFQARADGEFRIMAEGNGYRVPKVRFQAGQ